MTSAFERFRFCEQVPPYPAEYLIIEGDCIRFVF